MPRPNFPAAREEWRRWARTLLGQDGRVPGALIAERVRVREITNQEGQRLLRLVRRPSGSVVNLAAVTDGVLSTQGIRTDRQGG